MLAPVFEPSRAELPSLDPSKPKASLALQWLTDASDRDLVIISGLPERIPDDTAHRPLAEAIDDIADRHRGALIADLRGVVLLNDVMLESLIRFAHSSTEPVVLTNLSPTVYASLLAKRSEEAPFKMTPTMDEALDVLGFERARSMRGSRDQLVAFVEERATWRCHSALSSQHSSLSEVRKEARLEMTVQSVDDHSERLIVFGGTKGIREDTLRFAQLEAQLVALSMNPQTTNLTVHFDAVPSIDSSVAVALFRTALTLKGRNGELRLSGAGPEIREALERAKVAKVIRVVEG